MMTTDIAPFMDTVTDILLSSVRDVFSTTFEMDAAPVEFRDIRGEHDTLVAGSVGFTGDINGLVYVYFKAPFAHALASRMLDMPFDDVEEEMVDDVVGELSNMFVGATKSCLCDAGYPCKLTTPSIVRGQNLKAQSLRPSETRMLTMMCDGEPIVLELILTPAT